MMSFNNICSNKTLSTSLFFYLLWLSYAINGGFSSGVSVANLAVDCPQYIYQIPDHTYKVHKKYTWSVYGDKKQITTEALYFVRKIGNKDLVVGVCYRFGGSHYNDPRDRVPNSVRNSIQKACVVGPCHSGHLIPANIGGPNEPKNFIPQFGRLNSGKWKSFENFIRNHDTDTTIVLISLEYTTNSRPTVHVPNDMDIPSLHYQQPDVLNIIWFSDDNLYPDPLIYYCASVPNNMNNKDGVVIEKPLSKLTITLPLGPGRYGRCS